jgi:hypothetical protein
MSSLAISSARPAPHPWLGACVLAVALSGALLDPRDAAARALDDKERASLATTVSEFDAAMRDERFDRVLETVPPRVLASIAEKAGVSAEKMAPMMVEFIKQLTATVKIESFSMDLAHADYRELPAGEPYALIPTNTVIDLGAKGRMRERSFTVALIDGGKWYLVRVNDAAQLTIMREVYPEFTGVEIPRGSMEVMN